MKLFWKQFTTIVCLLVVLFTVFGSVFLQTFFQTMLEREKERGLEEWKMFQYALMASMEGLPQNYPFENKVMTEMSETIQNSIGNQENGIALYDDEKQLIYENGMYYGGLIGEPMMTGKKAMWRLIAGSDDTHYLEALSLLTSSHGAYYLAFSRNIQYVYDTRNVMYGQYRIAVLAVILLSIPVSWLLSYQFTKPIRQLSKATKDFARGNYESRVEVKGEDEIAELMKDFNKMAARLEKSIWELEDSARRQEEFTGAFAHELKTPLTSIIGYGEMLRTMELTEKEKQSSADYIYQQGKRLERLSYKMMELVRVDKQDIALKPVNTTMLSYEIERFTGRLLQQKGVVLRGRVEPGVIYGDMDLLCSLFGNLIDNAGKACSRKKYGKETDKKETDKKETDKKGEQRGMITLIGRQEKNGFSFAVMDNGCGIPADQVGKITEAFYMVDKSRARKEGGAGIGMTLCSRIVALHHARWKIESVEGQGTTVRIFFPEREEEEEDER